MTDQLSLLDAPEGAVVRKIQDDQETRHAAFLKRLRMLVHACWKGHEITTDQVRWTMDRYGLEFPEGASPNVMGSFFSSWPAAHQVMLDPTTPKLARSKRDGAHSNLLRVWRIK